MDYQLTKLQLFLFLGSDDYFNVKYGIWSAR